jgi:uncharacterized protein
MASKKEGKGNQGFASMDPEKQKEIASKGGKASHKGEEGHAQAGNSSEDDENETQGKRGFAAMDKEKVREIASKGGKASHRNDEEEEEEEYEEASYSDEDEEEDEAESEDEEEGGKSKRGFASMDQEKVKQIAKKGGKASHK